MTTRRTLERVARALLTPEERGYALHVYPPGTPPGACPACVTGGVRVSLKAPFPYFGGKALIAPLVWRRLGDVPNYVEPFFGSGAMLLARPDDHCWWDRVETANDRDGFVANFYRALQHDPDAVARYADRAVNENDLHAIHAWLVTHGDAIVARLEGDPDFSDARVAGWWVWGISAWLGGGWCSGSGPWRVVDGALVRCGGEDPGINRRRPHLGNAGQGINRRLPHLGNAGRGINRQRPHLGDAGQCAAWRAHLTDVMRALADRLRRVRVCSGDWERVCSVAPTIGQGLTGVFLDPPYAHTERRAGIYRQEMAVADAVRDWAVARGDDPRYRIALCGYEGEHAMPDTWTCVSWKAHGGYGHVGRGRGPLNAARERVWFSPHCLRPDSRAGRQASLFDVGETGFDEGETDDDPGNA